MKKLIQFFKENIINKSQNNFKKIKSKNSIQPIENSSKQVKFKQFRNGFIISLSLLALLYGFAPYALAYGKEFFSATDVDPKTIIKLQKERGVRLLGKPNLDLEPVIESPSILKIISSSNSLWFVLGITAGAGIGIVLMKKGQRLIVMEVDPSNPLPVKLNSEDISKFLK